MNILPLGLYAALQCGISLDTLRVMGRMLALAIDNRSNVQFKFGACAAVTPCLLAKLAQRRWLPCTDAWTLGLQMLSCLCTHCQLQTGLACASQHLPLVAICAPTASCNASPKFRPLFRHIPVTDATEDQLFLQAKVVDLTIYADPYDPAVPFRYRGLGLWSGGIYSSADEFMGG